jgi:hypothetical protein
LSPAHHGPDAVPRLQLVNAPLSVRHGVPQIVNNGHLGYPLAA